MWKRPEVVEICLRNFSYFAENCGHDIITLAILCPYDPDLKKLEQICRKWSVNICYSPNLPLGRKMNAGINYALRRFEWDYLMNFGSDDLIHPSLFELYKAYFELYEPLFGVDSLYFYDLKTDKTLFFKCYTDGLAVGAGRMIHRSVFDKLKENRIELYDNFAERGLDGCSSRRMKGYLGIYDTVISCGDFPYIVDIKTDTNINHMSSVEFHTQQVKTVDSSIIKQHFQI